MSETPDDIYETYEKPLLMKLGKLEKLEAMFLDPNLPPAVRRKEELHEKLDELIKLYKYTWDKREKYISQLMDAEHILNTNRCQAGETVAQRIQHLVDERNHLTEIVEKYE